MAYLFRRGDTTVSRAERMEQRHRVDERAAARPGTEQQSASVLFFHANKGQRDSDLPPLYQTISSCFLLITAAPHLRILWSIWRLYGGNVLHYEIFFLINSLTTCPPAYDDDDGVNELSLKGTCLNYTAF